MDNNDFDYNRMVKESLVKPHLRLLLNERKNFVLSLTEAIADANDNKCSYKKALDSVLMIATTRLLAAGKELEDYNMLV